MNTATTQSGRNQLRAWRVSLGLTQEDLAMRVQITPAHLSRLESGRNMPRRDTARRWASALRVPLPQLWDAIVRASEEAGHG